MDIASILLQGVSGFLVECVTNTAGSWFSDRLREFVASRKRDEVRRFLQELGCTTEAEIRWLLSKNGGGLSDGRREEVVAALVNLTRSARFVTTQGTARFGTLDRDDVVEALLGGIEPIRKFGEMVAPGRNWRLERFLGAGTFGEVWMACNPHDARLGRRAFKFFVRDNARDWILRERRNLGKIRDDLQSDPHIIQYYDVAIDGLDHPFLELEYVGGGSLEEWIVERDSKRRIPLKKDEIIKGLVRGLARAHEQFIYHRDLKPANILLTEPPDVQAKIGDFGLAVLADADHPLNTAGLQGGTPLYQSPESQQPFAERSPGQDDVFAVGVIWYQLLVESLDRPPYNFAERLNEFGVDSHTIRIISRCLAHPHQRFWDANELKEQVDSLIGPPAPPPPGQPDVQYLVREYLAALAQ